jgi:hypothetical protein
VVGALVPLCAQDKLSSVNKSYSISHFTFSFLVALLRRINLHLFRLRSSFAMSHLVAFFPLWESGLT